jgi:hypothetical protein
LTAQERLIHAWRLGRWPAKCADDGQACRGDRADSVVGAQDSVAAAEFGFGDRAAAVCR